MTWSHCCAAVLVAVAGLGNGVLRADARPVRFDHLSIDDGLSQSTVNCLFQDSRGFLWFGTEDGLNRYDGYAFRVYKNDPEDPATLGHDVVWAIDEDREGDLWIGTAGGGVARWSRSEDRFVRYGIDAGLSSPYVRTLRFDHDGTLWIGTRDSGLDRLDPGSEKIVPYENPGGDPSVLEDDSVYVIHTDRSGQVWIGTDNGLYRHDPADGTLVAYGHDPLDPTSLTDDRVRAIFEDRTGMLWIGTYGGLNRLDRSSGSIEHYRHDPADPASLGHDRVRAVLQDRAGRLWVGTGGGLDLLNPHGGFDHYRHDTAVLSSISDDHVMSLFEDRGGVLWAGTRTGGANKWNPRTWQFGHRAAEPSNPHGLSNNNVMAFSEDRAGKVWIATFGGGLDVLDRVSGRMKHYRHDPQSPGSLSSDRVMALEHDHLGNLWVGTFDGGLNRFDPETESFEVFRHDDGRPDSLAADGITTVLEDHSGALWIGTFGGGLDRFDPLTEKFEHHRHDPADPSGLGGDRVTALVQDARGLLWVGTDGGGLNRLDPDHGAALRFSHDPDEPSSLSSDAVFSLHIDAADTLWVGTRGSGLDMLPRAAEASGSAAFENYSERDGLPNEVIYGILSDAAGHLWLSTNNGLSRFTPRTEEFRNYDVSDGLQSNEFHFGSAYRSTGGEMFFGGVNGFNAFFPQRLQHNAHVPQVALTSFLKLNEEFGPASGIETIQLGYRDDVVTLEFAALDFSAPESNRYAYKLDGFDEDWIDLGNIHRVTYTNLDPGSYVFRVRAANDDGVWNESGLSMGMEVEPPPWRSSWAYVAYTIGLGGLVLGFVRAQRIKLDREAAYSRRLEREVQARTTELADRAAELEVLNEKLVTASVTDALTGLANRRFLLKYLDKEVSLIRRRYSKVAAGRMSGEGFDIAFMMVDLDSFKAINDTCGHAAGDTVLRELPGLLAESCRKSDILIRWGGDEFLIVGRDSDPNGLENLAERIRTRIGEHVFALENGQTVRTTCSIGFACYPFVNGDLDGLTWEQVVSLADRALYVAKQSGRDSWVGFTSTAQTPAQGLLAHVHRNLGELVDGGILGIRTSIAVPGELVWESPETESSSVRIEEPRPVGDPDGESDPQPTFA